jgi:anthranilate phosphoribosyltransferase
LANPGRVARLVVGAARADVMDVMAGVLVARGVQRAAVVHSDDGLDELSLGAASTIINVSPTGTTATRFDPSSVGRHHAPSEIRGGDVTDNADVVRRYLDGETGAVFDVVTANAGLALVVAGRVPDVATGMSLAAAAVADGSARRVLRDLVVASNTN